MFSRVRHAGARKPSKAMELQSLEARMLLTGVGFTPPVTPLPTGGDPFEGPRVVLMADLNGDGIPDAVLSFQNIFSQNGMEIEFGQPGGTFSAPELINLPGEVSNLSAAELTGDGHMDLIFTESTFDSTTIQVMYGNGDGTFQPPVQVAANGMEAVVGDFNGDGLPDIMVLQGANVQTGQFSESLLLNQGDGAFDPAPAPAMQFPLGTQFNTVAVGDFNGDGIDDFALTGNSFTSVDIYYGSRSGAFTLGSSTSLLAAGSTTQISQLIVGDFNNDGQPDILALTNGSSGPTDPAFVLLNQGGYSFSESSFSTFGPGDGFVADFNGDGNLDLLDGNSVYLGNGDGTFQSAIPISLAGIAVGIGDYNGDGRPDIVVSNQASPIEISVQLNVAPSGTTGQAILAGGILSVSGTVNNDTISIAEQSGNLLVTINGQSETFSAGSVNEIAVLGGLGDDTITIDGSVFPPAAIYAGGGDDSVAGGSFDTITGGGGNDTISANSYTIIYGGAGNDSLTSLGGNNDTLYGQAGNDTLNAGIAPSSVPVTGPIPAIATTHITSDLLIGGGGNDLLNNFGDNDTLDGGYGNDTIYGNDYTGVSLNGGPGDNMISIYDSVTLPGVIFPPGMPIEPF